ncbi:ATP-dependent DNA helicase RecG [uncultured Alistipes sp.]|uniref:ATP-dependent DNA helicase RecG n=1 Tax=uncultured Alistipes sp. TaxID=538949 RepID=UPI00259BA362|nr:ATP-dependent DNA helicase RecG [uncultured Alistipes sp.]
MGYILDNDIQFLSGVGERRARLLRSELGIRTLGDLLYHFPFRYIDRSRIWRIGELRDDSLTYVQLQVRITGFRHVGTGAKKRFVATVADATGTAELVWFKGIGWIEKRLEQGREYIVFGRPAFFGGVLSLVHPEVESVLDQKNRFRSSVQGVYSTTEKLSNAQLGTKAIHSLMCNLWPQVDGRLRETLPDEVIREYGLVPLRDALYNIHFPTSQQALRDAELRLKFDELLGIQLNILQQRHARTSREDGFLFPTVGRLFNTFYNERLPFPLTGAQKRVIREIRQDTVTGHQMNRLLQGDVGSGKTLVALMSMLLACDNGFQACLMAPTEILASQHYASIVRMTEGIGLRVGLLTGSTKKKERAELSEGLLSGEIDILIGTHALIENGVRFRNLGFVVIDEQHRFGVEQRARLWSKNPQAAPHVLVMTATPIPRTLAMTLYGDLDVSVIDELPPGRKPVKTVHYRDSHRLRVFGFIRDEIKRGRQVYVVYPLIKESEKMDYKDLEDGYAGIVQAFPPPEYVTVVVHGKMKAADKEYGMDLFKRGVAHIMVATSVIEVGVDVPNASIIVIESAERFGLSQLHQLRGRVGRGAEQSYCILMSGDKLSAESRKRLGAMVQTTDGFRLAEMDLQLRGPGDLSGTLQSGLAFDLKIASLGRDGQILSLARSAAERILEQDPHLERNAMLKELSDKYNSAENADFSMIS